METQQNLALDDPHARTQSEGLDVVYASASGSERFHRDSLFGGFSSMRALTYTPSIPMILALLRDYDYEDFECICGNYGVGPDEKRHSGLDSGRYRQRSGPDRTETRPVGIVPEPASEAPESLVEISPKLTQHSVCMGMPGVAGRIANSIRGSSMTFYP